MVGRGRVSRGYLFNGERQEFMRQEKAPDAANVMLSKNQGQLTDFELLSFRILGYIFQTGDFKGHIENEFAEFTGGLLQIRPFGI